jgi:cell division protein FtsL
MSSRSLPPVRARQQARVRVEQHALSLQVIVAITVALLILFLWMRFIVALQIESTGRQIQSKTEELERLQRSNAALQRDIAESMSQETLSERAQAVDYQLQPPAYLVISEPLIEPDKEAAGASIWLPTAESDGEPSLPQAALAPGALAHILDGSEEPGSASQP